jgi:hypothetical protein
VLAVGHDLEVEVVDGHGLRHADVEPRADDVRLAEGRPPRRGRVAVDGGRGPGRQQPPQVRRGLRREPAVLRPRDAQQRVEERLRRVGREAGVARQRERAGSGELEGPHHRELLVAAALLQRVGPHPLEEDVERRVGGAGPRCGQEVGGQAHHLVHPHVAHAHLGEADRAQPVVPPPLADVVAPHHELEAREAVLADVEPLPLPAPRRLVEVEGARPLAVQAHLDPRDVAAAVADHGLDHVDAVGRDRVLQVDAEALTPDR